VRFTYWKSGYVPRAMNRRIFIQGLAASLLTCGARAAPADAATVGVLSLTTADNFRSRADAFLKGMKALARAGRSVHYEWRYADDDRARVDDLASELVMRKPAVLVADSSLASLRLKQATVQIPIVMVGVEDPVADRFVRSLAVPETNMTGITAGSPDEILKAVHFLDTLLKKGEPVAMIFTQNNATYRKLRARFRHAVLEDGMRPVMLDANNPGEIAAAFDAAVKKERAAGLVLMNDAMFFNERARILKLAAAARRPVIYPDAAFVRSGGLMSYGPDLHATFTRAASFVDRILEGARPASLALEEPGDSRLTINRATARALKLAIPRVLLDQASSIG